MRIISIIGLCILCSSGFASVPKGCPQTRACKIERDCKIYAFKHNCHGICQERVLNFPDGQKTQCPAQCVCESK